MKFAVIDACPAPRSIAPYIYLVVRRAGQQASSIYRGEDARDLLHKLGKRTQAEIHRDLPTISNPAGRSQHECRSDGVGNPGPVGRRLHEWEVGIDSGGDDPGAKAAVEAAAAYYGWKARHPYARGVEGHHWCFAEKPEAKTVSQKAAVLRARVALAIFPPALRLGSRGPRAQLLKRRLVRLGYLPKYVRGPLAKPAIDALKAFQKAHHLTPDGVAGPATQDKVRAAVKAAPKQKSPRPPRHPQQGRATRASARAIALIADFEGFRAYPYRDAVGVWTIGYGETKGIGPNTPSWSEQHARAELERRVNHDFAPHVQALPVALNQNQFDALTSVVYNLGPGVLEKGRSLGDALRARDMRAAADAILLYDKAGSPPRALPGLTRRRRAERDLFLK